jgi:hypothetical protein
MKRVKNIVRILLSCLFLIFLSSCQEEDQVFGEIIAPSNLTIDFEIIGLDAVNPNGDGSGLVNFTATADNAIAYRFNFGDNTGDFVAPGGANTHRFNQVGLNTYVVTLIATGQGGVSSSISIEIDVYSNFNPIEIKNMLTGGLSNSKTWYWHAAVPAHLGVGPLDETIPSYYSASPFEKEDVGCLYEDELIFSQDENEVVSFELLNLGNTYFHRLEVEDELGQPNPGEDTCYEYDTSGVNTVNFSPSSSGIDATISTQTSLTIQGKFMSYFLGNNEYEILSITDSEIHVRVIQTEPSGSELAWYQKFSTSPPINNGGLCTGETGEIGSGNNDVLVWADEFDIDGAPCEDNWRYDMGAGGWGNNEAQYYTDRPENVIVENGLLKITTIAESFSGSDYTSARLKSEQRFDFTYGKVEVRAKFPEGGGTWPAIWMLGANFDIVGWPDCGEIDIAEHVGNNQNTIYGTLHYPGNSGGNANGNTVQINNASSEFHIYEVQWTADTINFFVDGQQYHTFENDPSVPFNHDFFLILNTAMGGDLGGSIDPNFDQSTFEIDYVRVYQ